MDRTDNIYVTPERVGEYFVTAVKRLLEPLYSPCDDTVTRFMMNTMNDEWLPLLNRRLLPYRRKRSIPVAAIVVVACDWINDTEVGLRINDLEVDRQLTKKEYGYQWVGIA